MSATLTQRARPRRDPSTTSRLDAWAGHPLAFAATAALLLALFGWTFVANPERVAPTKDPAYYTWRTEALLSENPRALLDIEGAFDMFAGGYRVAAPVIAGFLRRVAGVSPLRSTAFLMVGAPVLTALLLGGFAYRHRRDPLIYHAVALGSASLFLTPPFVGYLDNVLSLLCLAAALWFIAPSRDSWRARIGLALFLFISGLTHPTTLVIFCLTLGAMAAVRLLFRRFDIRSVFRDDAPMLVTAFLSAVVVYVVWKVGIWGKPASLTEAALPPPYDSGFFVQRLLLWVDQMRPLLNAPLFLIGAVGLLVAGRRWVEDDLARVSIVWLAPLVGVFGFLAGRAYPYYRFFNTTLAWVLLVGVGAFFVVRYFVNRAHTGAAGAVAAVAVTAAVLVIFATNLMAGFDQAGWNDPNKGWLSAQTKQDLDALRAHLSDTTNTERPVVFVIDDETETFQIWGFTKLAGNTSRYGLPHGQIDRGHLYLGSLESYLDDAPTVRGQETYDKLSRALLAEARDGIERARRDPVIVVASAFNKTGANVDAAQGEVTRRDVGASADDDVWWLHDGAVGDIGSDAVTTGVGERSGDGLLHALWVIVGVALLVLPGVLALGWFLDDAGFKESLGMAPTLSMTILGVIGVVALAVTRSPFSGRLAWLCLAAAIALGGVLLVRPTRRSREAQ